MDNRELFEQRLERELIKSAEQLPDLNDDTGSIVLDWDYNAPSETIIKYGDKEIWHQPAPYEGYLEFCNFCKIAKQKYGDRLVDVCPTKRSEIYLYGDAWSSIDAVAKARAALQSSRRTSQTGKVFWSPRGAFPITFDYDGERLTARFENKVITEKDMLLETVSLNDFAQGVPQKILNMAYIPNTQKSAVFYGIERHSMDYLGGKLVIHC